MLAAALLALTAAASASAEFELVVQGDGSTKAGKWSALSDYLSQALGQPVRVNMRRNPLEHWRHLTSAERPAMVLEDPHFADYRVTRAGYRIIAAVEERQVFALAGGGFLLLDPLDLAGRPVAALSPPSLSTLQLLAFYSDAVRIPRIIEAPSHRAAAARVLRNEAVAAVIPADDLGIYPELKEMLLMEELPGKAVSVSPDLAEVVVDRMTSALIDASRGALGRRALTELEISGFVRGHQEAYSGFSRLLKGTWGYRQVPP
jgi:ABC-type phosphate/phosphonate transport system substrate-binding protein